MEEVGEERKREREEREKRERREREEIFFASSIFHHILHPPSAPTRDPGGATRPRRPRPGCQPRPGLATALLNDPGDPPPLNNPFLDGPVTTAPKLVEKIQ